VAREIARRGDGHQLDRLADPHRDHVTLDAFVDADASIEALGDDIGQRRLDRDLEPDFGIGREEARHDRSEDELRRRRQHRQAQRAGRPIAEGIDRFERRGEIVEHRPQPFHQKLAGIGQPDAAGGAVEQPQAEPLLELADRLAQGRAGDAEMVGGAGEALALGYGDESSELGEIGRAH
jgi:hypothetical protein